MRKKRRRTRTNAPDASLGRASASDHETHNKIAQEEECYPRRARDPSKQQIMRSTLARTELLYSQAGKLQLLPEDRTFKSGADLDRKESDSLRLIYRCNMPIKCVCVCVGMRARASRTQRRPLRAWRNCCWRDHPDELSGRRCKYKGMKQKRERQKKREKGREREKEKSK